LLQRAMKAFQKQKTWIIRILIVLIVADIVAIITLLKRIKRYELWWKLQKKRNLKENMYQ
jgi:hypothetical protein